MAGRGPQTFKKRQKEQQRKEKQQEKAERRLLRKQNKENGIVEPDDDIELELDEDGIPIPAALREEDPVQQ